MQVGTVRGDENYVQHEASVSKVNEEMIFYMQQRGLTEGQAMSLAVNGFINDLAARFERKRIWRGSGRRLPDFTPLFGFRSGSASRAVLGKAPAIDHLEVGNVVLVLRHTTPSEAVSRPRRVASDAQQL